MNGVVGKLLLSVNAVESVILNLLSITRITNCFWCCVFSKTAKMISREAPEASKSALISETPLTSQNAGMGTMGTTSTLPQLVSSSTIKTRTLTLRTLATQPSSPSWSSPSCSSLATSSMASRSSKTPSLRWTNTVEKTQSWSIILPPSQYGPCSAASCSSPAGSWWSWRGPRRTTCPPAAAPPSWSTPGTRGRPWGWGLSASSPRSSSSQTSFGWEMF